MHQEKVVKSAPLMLISMQRVRKTEQRIVRQTWAGFHEPCDIILAIEMLMVTYEIQKPLLRCRYLTHTDLNSSYSQTLNLFTKPTLLLLFEEMRRDDEWKM